jgi:hypothetical protein
MRLLNINECVEDRTKNIERLAELLFIPASLDRRELLLFETEMQKAILAI